MNLSLIKEGENLIIKSLSQNGAGKSEAEEKTVQASAFKVIEDKNLIDILVPETREDISFFDAKKVYEVNFSNENGRYFVRTKAKGKYKSEENTIIRLQIISELKKHQQRESFRVNENVDIRMVQVDKEIKNDLFKSEYLDEAFDATGITLDISAGGLKFLTKKKCERGDYLLLELEMPTKKENTDILFERKRGKKENVDVLKTPDFSYIYVIFKVLACKEDDSGYYTIHGSFSKIDSNCREKLVKYIFLTERDNRKRDINRND